MLIAELIGKKITNVYQILDYEDGGLDSSECFVELDNKFIIEIPYSFNSFSDTVHIKELKEGAKSIFSDLKDYPVYYVNKEGKSIKEIVDKYADKKLTVFEKIKQLLFKQDPIAPSKHIIEYEPYKVEYRENKSRYIKNAIIKDLITFGENDERYFFELDNGYYITETNFSPNGTGRVGINLYENFGDIISWKGNDFTRFSDQLG